MNRQSDRSRLLITALAAATLIGMVVFAFSDVRRSSRRAETAASNLEEAKTLADQIRRMNNRPRQASLQAESPSRITQRITSASRAAGVELRLVTSLAPQSPTRVGQSDYEVRTTSISLEDVSLRQLAVFCETLADPSSGLIIQDLTLDARPGTSSDAGGERWNARMALTQTIFSPISPRFP